MVKLILEIMDLAINISQNSIVDVFVDYSGHVNNMRIRVYEQGWSSAHITTNYTLWLTDEPIAELQEILTYLQSFRTEATIIAALDEKIEDLENEIEDLKEKIEDLENEIEDLKEKIEDLENEIEDLENEIEDLKEKISDLENELTEMANFSEEDKKNYNKYDV
jgi:peptidoglycan hydrolase CwlO-like protein